MALRAAIFDLDGTLIDSLGDIGDSMNRALRHHGHDEHPLSSYRQFVGEGVRNLVIRALPKDASAKVEAVLATYRGLYAEALLDTTRPYPGVVDAVKALSLRGLRLCVLSNKADPPTKKLIAALFAEVPFERVYGEREGTPRKPNPQGALALCRELGVAPAECAFIGDTKVDMETATAAGMYAVGVAWGFRDEAELRASGARVVLHRASELVDALGTPAE